MSHERWREVLDYARWAPSPHNIQSWKFRLVSDTEALTLFDPTRLLPDTDPTGRFCTAGFGILHEMMSIAAAPLGLDVQVEPLGVPLDAKKKEPTPFARLRLVPRQKPEPLSRELIRQRRTSRLPYDDHPVSATVLSELQAVAAEYGHVLEYSNEPEQVSWVVGLNADTMFYDMSDPIARNEVGGWIRFSRREAERRKDGLAAYAMGFPGWLMRLFVHANYLFRIPGLYQVNRYAYLRSMRGTRTVVWLSGGFTTFEECDRAGRMLARLWLTMTKHGVYLHPFGSVITNKTAHKRMEERFANGNREHPLWLLMRLGHSELPPQAQRIPLNDLIVS